MGVSAREGRLAAMFASDLSYRVLQRQRREAEVARLQPDQSPQSFYAHVPGAIKAAIVREHLLGERESSLLDVGDGSRGARHDR